MALMDISLYIRNPVSADKELYVAAGLKKKFFQQASRL